MSIFAASLPLDRLEAEARAVCEQLMVPRDQQLCTLQANLLDQWVRRRRAVGYESELDDTEVIALAVRLRVPDLADLALTS